MLISSAHSDSKAAHAKSALPSDLIPNMLDVLQRVVRPHPWSERRLDPVHPLPPRRPGCPSRTSGIKHAATSSGHLDRDGMTAVLDMYASWCGYLKRRAMDPNASEEAVDLAEVGLPSALEDVRHWGKRRYGDAYQGDPKLPALEKILIQFLAEKRDDQDAAQRCMEPALNDFDLMPIATTSGSIGTSGRLLSSHLLRAKRRCAAPRLQRRSQAPKTPSPDDPGFRPGAQVWTLDWPERVMEVYLQHCNDHELPNTLRDALDTVYKTRKGVAKRRERKRGRQRSSLPPGRRSTPGMRRRWMTPRTRPVASGSETPPPMNPPSLEASV